MRLIDCFADALSTAFAYLGAIEAGAGPDYDEVRAGIEGVLAANATYAGGGYTDEQYNNAKFAVVALIDERILLSNWEHRHQWAHEMLQQQHFGTNNAGEEFYERLDALSAFEPGERDVREVYVYCLALGFVGKFYRPGDRARLEQIRDSNFRILRESDDVAAVEGTQELFPGALGARETGDLRPPQRRKPVLYYGVPAVVLLATYVALRVDLISAGERIVRAL